jgi:mRNA interferase MazF
VGLAISCPVTSRPKGYPFEVALPEDLEVAGVVLADQLKSLDWRARRTARIAIVPDSVLAEVLAKIRPLVAS